MNHWSSGIWPSDERNGTYRQQVEADELVELVQRRKDQAPPPSVVWDALANPGESNRPWHWCVPTDSEVMPVVITSTRPTTIVWSSIWTDAPGVRISFEVEPQGEGSLVTWRLLGRPEQFDPDELRHRRRRINHLINGELRAYFDL